MDSQTGVYAELTGITIPEKKTINRNMKVGNLGIYKDCFQALLSLPRLVLRMPSDSIRSYPEECGHPQLN